MQKENRNLTEPNCPKWAIGKWEFASPNGLPAWVNLQRWMADSCVVDDDGAPIRVFHGTNQTFNTFEVARLGENTKAASSIAFFFSECAAEAAEYADMAGRKQVAQAVEHERLTERFKMRLEKAEAKNDWGEYERIMEQWEAHEFDAIDAEPQGMQILPVFLRIQNPLIIDLNHSFDSDEVIKGVDYAKENGFDGLMLLNVWDPTAPREDKTSTTQWVAFSPDQVISAIGDSGDFELTRPSRNKDERKASFSPVQG